MAISELQVTGTLVWYYAICRREAWLMAHQIEPERENDLLALGRLNQEEHYPRAIKELSLPGIRVDQIRREKGRLVLSEVKKSSRFVAASRLQLGYYLLVLLNEGVAAEGEILIPKERKCIQVTLDSDLREEVETAIHGIRSLCAAPKPPPASWLHFCATCAYAEFCWSGDP